LILKFYAAPQGNNGLKEKYQNIAIVAEMSEDDEQVEQRAVKHDLFSMPSDTGEHGFVVDKSDGNTEAVPVHQADIKNEWDAMPVDCGSLDSEASNENTEEKHVDEEFEEEITAQAESQQELDSVALVSWEQVTETSSENTEKHVEQPELKHLSTSMAVGIHESLGVNTIACKGKMLRLHSVLFVLPVS
jgi:hypothetical protein